MADGWIAPEIVAEWLDSLQEKPCYAGLVTANPFTVSDPLSTEVYGSAYRRTPVLWERVGSVLRNENALNWRGIAPMTRLAGIAGWNLPFNGVPMLYVPLDEPLDYPLGGNFDFDRRELYVGVDS